MDGVEQFDEQRFTHNIARHLDRLISAWQDKAEYDRRYDEFVNNNQPPDPPERFDSITDLYAYNRAKETYEERLRAHERRRLDYAGQFDELAQKILPLLPEGIPLIYDQRVHQGLQDGGRYEIVHVVDRPTVQIRQLDR